jgi:O-antigen/teichoic acid export membrane protein
MFKKVLTTFLTRMAISFSGLAVAILLSHYLGAAGRGEQSLLITLISFVIVITSMIGTSSISYLIPRYAFSTLILPAYLWVLIVNLMLLLLLPFFRLVPENYVPHVCALALVLSLSNIHIMVLISHQRINAANFLNLLQGISLLLCLLIGFVFLKSRNIEVYIISLYISYGITLLVSMAMTLPYFRGFTLPLSAVVWIESVKKLATLGFFNQVAVFAQMLSFRLSYYLLNAHFGKEEVGLYSNAVSVAESVWLFSRSMGIVQHSRIIHIKEPLGSVNLTARLNKITLLFSVLITLGVVCVPDAIYRMVFGNDFQHLNQITWTLAPGIVSFCMVLILGYYFSSTGKHYVNAIASLAGLAIALIMNFMLIPSMGSRGAGLASSFSYAVTALITLIFFRAERRKLSVG